jgi:phosphoesterase RecJ-like protein
MTDLLAVPAHRVEPIRSVLAAIGDARTVALSTHVNADGDGCGSEAALARLLTAAGKRVRIVNPTPWPQTFEYLLDADLTDLSAQAVRALEGIDLLAVVDIGDVKRLGVLTDSVRALAVPRVVIDHHEPGTEPPGRIILSDTTACATGELIFDLAMTAGWTLSTPAAVALYTALLTDTGGFRFSNTSPRCHAIAGYLLSLGIDPEEMYRRVYASVPLGRLLLLRDALETLEVDPVRAIAWISVPAGAVERYALRSEDLDGIVEHPRSIAGTGLAIFFRDLGHGKVKVSFRSTGDVDVNRFARQFGGGGHAKAAGALIPGSLEQVREEVIAAARAFVGVRAEPPPSSAGTPSNGAMAL